MIREQGVEFAILIVKPHIVQFQSEGRRLIGAWQMRFGVPVVLMAQDFMGTPTYFGRPDIVSFLSNVPLDVIPWREFSLN
jgi:hypothetical protein